MGNETFILDNDGTPIPEPDTLRWELWIETHREECIVERTEITPYEIVSTVFLGFNTRYSGKGPPLLWETAVVGGWFNGRGDHYSSREKALIGHQRMVKYVNAGHRAELVESVRKGLHGLPDPDEPEPDEDETESN